jgi:DNA-directed RNA polymerase subunit RPC12/RpoP
MHPEPPEVAASRNAMAEIIATAPAQAPFKCLRCNRIFRAQALRVLAQLRCRRCGRRDFVSITEAQVEALARS